MAPDDSTRSPGRTTYVAGDEAEARRQGPWHPSVLAASLVVTLIGGGFIWFLQSQTSDAGRSVPTGVVGFVGGCEPFSVFAQNRWEPYGAARRVAPNRNARQDGNFDPNQLVPINGWVRTQPGYPSNTPPWNSDVWFHLADNSGWVSFAAVRADPTENDPTGHAEDGGRPVPTTKDCSGAVR